MNGFFAGILTPVRMFWSCAVGCPTLRFFFCPFSCSHSLQPKPRSYGFQTNNRQFRPRLMPLECEDTIFVRPGVYFENIKFLGKSVSVVSEKGFAVTTIDGGQQDSVVTYTGGERGVLAGFTIRNGKSGFDTPGFGNGGGIRMDNGAQPTILQNMITGNRACSGAGIAASFSLPHISENLITDNVQFGCSGGVGGAGVSIVDDEGQPLFTQIIGNTISNNRLSSASGAGISLFSGRRC